MPTKKELEKQVEAQQGRIRFLLVGIYFFLLCLLASYFRVFEVYGRWLRILCNSTLPAQAVIPSDATNINHTPSRIAKNDDILSMCKLHAHIDISRAPTDDSPPILIHEHLGIDISRPPFPSLSSQSQGTSNSREVRENRIREAAYAALAKQAAIAQAKHTFRTTCSLGTVTSASPPVGNNGELACILDMTSTLAISAPHLGEYEHKYYYVEENHLRDLQLLVRSFTVITDARLRALYIKVFVEPLAQVAGDSEGDDVWRSWRTGEKTEMRQKLLESVCPEQWGPT